MNLKPELKAELEKELKTVNAEMQKKFAGKVSPKGKAQIDNLIDKVDVRKAMPNFTATFPVTEGYKEITISLSEFLIEIDTVIPKTDKKNMAELERKKVSLELLLKEDK